MIEFGKIWYVTLWFLPLNVFAEPQEANQDVKSADNETMVSMPSVFETIEVFNLSLSVIFS